MKIRYRNSKGSCSEVWAANRFYGKVDLRCYGSVETRIFWFWTGAISEGGWFGQFPTRDAAAKALTTVRPRAKLQPWITK